MIPYGCQDITEEDIAAVVDVLRSDFITQGPVVGRFESALAGRCDAGHGVAVSNGTAGLHLALLALGVGPGDLVWTSSITFVASANAARYCGAAVDFVDIDPGTANLCPDRLAEKLERAERDGSLPKVVVPVHFAGQSSAMDRISELSGRYGFRILEDASHALGGAYRGAPVGSCRWSDATVHSFHPVKIITTGEGGMVTTNDEELAWRLSTLRTHGITRDSARMTGASHGPWYYQQLELGYNYRLTDLQSALGLSQLGRLDEFAARRSALAARYDEALAGFPLRPLARDRNATSGWHLYVVRLDLSAIGCNRREVFDRLRAAGVGVNVHYIPVHLQPDYVRLGFSPGQFPEAERYYEECLSLPLFPGLSDEQFAAVVEAVRLAVQ